MTFLSCIVLLTSFLPNYALAFYCEFGFCEGDKYCCGDNECCDRLTDLWYFWIGIVIVVIFIIAVIFLKYYQSKHKLPYSQYNLLTSPFKS
ncbi:hypothetical protein MTP99_006042 [Tenebrio molitor]|nr:hypothetical protein MTP99_006042 [Tenebrio molitor]CAH1382126.1 unnamed protein product [Tenebrio molitor]